MQVIQQAGDLAAPVALRPERGHHCRIVQPCADLQPDRIHLHTPLSLDPAPDAPREDIRRPKDRALRPTVIGRISAANDAQAEDGGCGINLVSLFFFGIRIFFNGDGVGFYELTASPDASQLPEFFRRPESPSLAKMVFW